MGFDGFSYDRPPVLLIHGAFAGAWMWEGAFLGSMTEAGLSVSALDRGDVDGRLSGSSPETSYQSIIARAVMRCPIPPILVTHSLGALLAQRLLGRMKISALVMLAPVPPEGMLFETPLLFATQPALWHGLWNFLNGKRQSAFQSMVDIVFSRQVEATEINRGTAKMVFESPATVFDAHLPLPVMPAFCVGVPALVIAGAEDKLISRLASVRTALYHGAEYRNEDMLGHFMQIGPGAQRTADFVVDWLKRTGL
jgi:pimeloyl-ACP methyl ester carboxylesterase